MFWYDKDQERVMQHKKREVIRELEETKNRILKELSGVDKVTLTRLREVLADYNRIDHAINEKIKNFMSNGTVILEGSQEIAELFKEEIKKIDSISQNYETISTHKSSYLNVITLGADNTGKTDNSSIFNQLFNSEEYRDKTFFIPNGLYHIGSMVTVNNGASIILESKAIIKATKEMESMFAFNTTPAEIQHVAIPYYKNSHRFISGGIFDADLKAERCISMRQYFDTFISDVTFYHIKIGIDTTQNLGSETHGEGAELLMQNVRFQNGYQYTGESVGIKVANDNIVDNALFYNVSKPIKTINGGNQFSNIHAWVDTPELSSISRMFSLEGVYNSISNCYCDSICCAVYGDRNGYTNISNLEYLMQWETLEYEGSIFDGEGTIGISNVVILSTQDINFVKVPGKLISLRGFQSQNGNCLPFQPSYEDINWQNYTNDKPIETLENIRSGFYSGQPLGRPVNIEWGYYDIKKFNGGNYFMVCYSTSGKLFHRFGKWNGQWFDSEGNKVESAQ